jgi:iron complex transport system substrate-binding protein
MNAPRKCGMRRRQGLQLALGALVAGPAASLGAWAQQAAAPAPAARLVSLSGALTEVVYLLGAEQSLVGTDTTSLFPEAAQRTAKVGYVRQLSAEGLLSLRPDAVVGTSEAGPPVVIEQVRKAGVRVSLVQAQHTWADVQEKVALVGRETGRMAQAQALQARLDAQWEQVCQQVAAAGRRPRAMFVLSHSGSPMAAGRGTAADALLRFAGLTNVITEFQGYRALTAEALASAAPDVIVNTVQGIEALGGEAAFWKRPEWALTPAYPRRALVALEASLLLGFGPRLPAAVAALHASAMQRSA